MPKHAADTRVFRVMQSLWNCARRAECDECDRVCVHAEGECSVASGVYMWRMYRQSIIIALEEPLAVQNQSDSAVCRSMRPIRVCFV